MSPLHAAPESRGGGPDCNGRTNIQTNIFEVGGQNCVEYRKTLCICIFAIEHIVLSFDKYLYLIEAENISIEQYKN